VATDKFFYPEEKYLQECSKTLVFHQKLKGLEGEGAVVEVVRAADGDKLGEF